MPIRMLITDLDNTLLRTDKTISAYSAAVLQNLIERGVVLGFATGRPIRAVRTWLSLPVPMRVEIFHNGAVVYIDGKRIGGFGIENPDALARRLAFAFPEAAVAVEANDRLYANFDAGRIWKTIDYTHTLDFAETHGMTADKLLVEAHSLEEAKRYEAFLPPELYMEFSTDGVGMIMNRKARKEEGIRLAAGALGIGMSEIAAFGDDYNDIGMLRTCGVGVAVENALPEVIAAADAVCACSDEDGLAKWAEENI